MATSHQSVLEFRQVASLLVRASIHAYAVVVAMIIIAYWWQAQLIAPWVEWSVVISVGILLFSLAIVLPSPARLSRAGVLWSIWSSVLTIVLIVVVALFVNKTITGRLGLAAAVLVVGVGLSVWSVCWRRLLQD